MCMCVVCYMYVLLILKKTRRSGDAEKQEGGDWDRDINKIDDPAFLSILLPLISIFLKKIIKVMSF